MSGRIGLGLGPNHGPLNRWRKLDGYESGLRVEIVLSAFVDHADITVTARMGIGLAKIKPKGGRAG